MRLYSAYIPNKKRMCFGSYQVQLTINTVVIRVSILYLLNIASR